MQARLVVGDARLGAVWIVALLLAAQLLLVASQESCGLDDTTYTNAVQQCAEDNIDAETIVGMGSSDTVQETQDANGRTVVWHDDNSCTGHAARQVAKYLKCCCGGMEDFLDRCDTTYDAASGTDHQQLTSDVMSLVGGILCQGLQVSCFGKDQWIVFVSHHPHSSITPLLVPSEAYGDHFCA